MMTPGDLPGNAEFKPSSMRIRCIRCAVEAIEDVGEVFDATVRKIRPLCPVWFLIPARTQGMFVLLESVLFPLDRCRRFCGNVVNDPVNMRHFVHNS